MTNPVLEAIRTRRIARALTDQPIERAELEEVLKAARGRQAPATGDSIASSPSRTRSP